MALLSPLAAARFCVLVLSRWSCVLAKPGALVPWDAAAGKYTLDQAHKAYVAGRVAEDLASLQDIQGLSVEEVDHVIKRRRGLKGQMAFSPIPSDCNGPNCLSPGVAGQDNGQGLRSFDGMALNGPAAAHVSLSWDVELVYFHAHMIGGFFKEGHLNAMLGPGGQVWRNPLCGRSWEYISGEDPILGVRLAEAWTLGLNKQSVAPVLKHYINNDKEKDRMKIRGNLTVPWEAQMDIYLKPFVAGSNIGASSTMCGYHWLVDPEGGKPVSSCFNKRLKWLREASNRTFVVSDYPAMEMWETYTKPGSRSDAGHSWANYNGWKIPLEYEHRTAQEQFEQSEGVVEEDNGHQVMGNGIEHVDRATKDRYLAGFVGWAKDLGLYKNSVYTNHVDGKGWDRTEDKGRFYTWVSRTIAESFVLLKNEGNMLPLMPSETIRLDESCMGAERAANLTAHGSGEMPNHLKETTAEAAFRDKTGGSPRLTLVCSIMSAGEGSDRKHIEQPRPNITNGSRTCALVIGAGAAAIPWADDVACIIFGIVPSVHTFTGLRYLMYGVVNPSAHLISSLTKAGGDLEFSDGESKRETAYMMLQSQSKTPAFEFGWGLPFGVQREWSELVELVPVQHERSLRRISFCFRAKYGKAWPHVLLPSPTAQFYVQVEGRPWKQLLTFAKFRGLAGGAKECMLAFYDPVAEWSGANDGAYVARGFRLFYGLSGYTSTQEWPEDLDQGLADEAPFDRQGYAAQVWKRHLSNQHEVGNAEPEGKIFVQPGRATSSLVLDLWGRLDIPVAITMASMVPMEASETRSDAPWLSWVATALTATGISLLGAAYRARTASGSYEQADERVVMVTEEKDT